MSNKARDWAYELDGLSSAQKFVLVTLADYADPAGRAWPSAETLGKRCSLSERHVRTVLGDLERLGLMRIRRRQRATSMFYLNYPGITKEALANAPSGEPELPNSASDGVAEAASPKGGMGEAVSGQEVLNRKSTAIPDRKLTTVYPEPVSGDPLRSLKEDPRKKEPPDFEPMTEQPVETVKASKALREIETAPTVEAERLSQIVLGEAKPSFEVFWEEYPKKVSKGAARVAYDKALKAKKATAEEVLAGLRRAMLDQTFPTDPKYIPHPATWLNREQWEDWRTKDGTTYVPPERQTLAGVALERRIAEELAAGDDEDSLEAELARITPHRTVLNAWPPASNRRGQTSIGSAVATVMGKAERPSKPAVAVAQPIAKRVMEAKPLLRAKPEAQPPQRTVDQQLAQLQLTP